MIHDASLATEVNIFNAVEIEKTLQKVVCREVSAVLVASHPNNKKELEKDITGQKRLFRK